MGLCLSCLRPREDSDEFNERSSLLRGQEFYSDEHLQEELLKKQQRQQELNNIVNELSDNLIDVSTFLSQNSGQGAAPSLAAANFSIVSNSSERTYPRVLGKEEKDTIEAEAQSADQAVKDACKVKVGGQLYLEF